MDLTKLNNALGIPNTDKVFTDTLQTAEPNSNEDDYNNVGMAILHGLLQLGLPLDKALEVALANQQHDDQFEGHAPLSAGSIAIPAPTGPESLP